MVPITQRSPDEAYSYQTSDTNGQDYLFFLYSSKSSCETSYLVHMFPRIMTVLDVKTISTRRLSYSSKVARQYQEAIDAFLLGDVELVEQLMRTR